MTNHVRAPATAALVGLVAPFGALVLQAAPASAAPRATAAPALLAQALQAARSASAVEWTTSPSSASVRLDEVTVAGRTSGTQRVAYTVGKTSGTVEIRLVGGVAYVHGSALVLEDFMGLTSSAARREAGRWLALRSSSADYPAVSAGLTVATVVSMIEMKGKVSIAGHRTIGGVAVVGLKGTTVASAAAPSTPEVLWVRAKGTPLPVESVQSSGGQTGVVHFGPWDHPPKVSKPAGAVTFSTSWLQGG